MGGNKQRTYPVKCPVCGITVAHRLAASKRPIATERRTISYRCENKHVFFFRSKAVPGAGTATA
jgi:hypothetical protein